MNLKEKILIGLIGGCFILNGISAYQIYEARQEAKNLKIHEKNLEHNHEYLKSYKDYDLNFAKYSASLNENNQWTMNVYPLIIETAENNFVFNIDSEFCSNVELDNTQKAAKFVMDDCEVVVQASSAMFLSESEQEQGYKDILVGDNDLMRVINLDSNTSLAIKIDNPSEPALQFSEEAKQDLAETPSSELDVVVSDISGETVESNDGEANIDNTKDLYGMLDELIQHIGVLKGNEFMELMEMQAPLTTLKFANTEYLQFNEVLVAYAPKEIKYKNTVTINDLDWNTNKQNKVDGYISYSLDKHVRFMVKDEKELEIFKPKAAVGPEVKTGVTEEE